MLKPKDSQHFVDATHYKAGANGVVYRHNGKGWVSTTRGIKDIKKDSAEEVRVSKKAESKKRIVKLQRARK